MRPLNARISLCRPSDPTQGAKIVLQGPCHAASGPRIGAHNPILTPEGVQP
jgi:hypothetical protein